MHAMNIYALIAGGVKKKPEKGARHTEHGTRRKAHGARRGTERFAALAE
jgi:hypothetical protein